MHADSISVKLSAVHITYPLPFKRGLVTARCMLLVKTDVNMEYFMSHRADSYFTLNPIVLYTFILRLFICCIFLFWTEMFFLRFAFCILIKKLFCTLMSLTSGRLLHIDNCATYMSSSMGCKKSIGGRFSNDCTFWNSFLFAFSESCSR